MSSAPTPTFPAVRYAGLRVTESLVLFTWLQANGAQFDDLLHNFAVGKGTDPGASFPENIRQQFIKNTQHKLDVLALKGTQPLIIEVKDQANVGAIGQCLCYKIMLAGDHPEWLPAHMLILYRTVKADVLPCAAALGVEMVQVTIPAV